MIHRQVDDDLKELKTILTEMGGHVEHALDLAIKGLTERSTEYLDSVFQTEDKVNRAHLAVDEKCLQILAKQSPMAADLRLVIACIKINTDLERMGDQAVNIAMNGKRYIGEEALKPLVDLPKMVEETRFMIRESIESFVTRNIDLAQQVLERDDVVDALKDKIVDELKELMQRDSSSVARALCLILIARNLERLGDHATNIAEDVIFAVTGNDIRHPSIAR